MNRIVKEHFPVSKLPEELREGLDLSADARVVIEQSVSSEALASLEEIFASRRPPFRTAEDIDADLRRQRDEWDERG